MNPEQKHPPGKEARSRTESGQYFEAVKDILVALANSVSALKIYPAENPTVKESIDALYAKFNAFLEEHDKLEMEVEEFSFICNGQVVYTDPLPIKSLPFFFFKDGLYTLYFYNGLDRQELADFLELIKRESQKPSEESDIVTALWEMDFSNIHYYAPDYYLENRVIDEARKSLGQKADSLLPGELLKENIEMAVDTSQFTTGRIDLKDEDMIEASKDRQPGSGAAPEQSPAGREKSPAASMDPILTQAELETVEDMIRSNRNLVPEEEFIELMVELTYLESDLQSVRATLDAFYEYHLEKLEKGDFSVVILIVKKIRRLLDYLNEKEPDKAALIESFMKKIASPRTLEAVQKLLRKDRNVELDSLLAFFKILGISALSLAADLYESNPDLALRARILEFVSSETSHDPGLLAGLADDSRPEFSREVVSLLEKVPSGKGIPHLAVFLNFTDLNIKIAAVTALAKASGDTANSILLGFLNDKIEDVRIQAALRLNPVKEKSRILKIIREASTREFREKSLKEKEAVFSFIGRSRIPEALIFLKKQFLRRSLFPSRSNFELKLAAVKGLEEMADENALKLLEKGTLSGNKNTARACSEAIIRISGQSGQRTGA